MAADVGHYFSGDLGLSATGGLQAAEGAIFSRQRILRRLLTNPGDYIWEPDYGAGLPRYIGRKLDLAAITALIRSQMYLESSVQQQPEPQIHVTPIMNGIFVRISYVEAETGRTETLSFEVTA
jgi:phage baseplate assembly protein W